MNDEVTRRLQRVIETSKMRGYAVYAEVAALVPEDSSDSPDEVLAALERAGVEFLEARPQPIRELTEWGDDPVQVYRHEVAALPVVTREQEMILTERVTDGYHDVEWARKDLVGGEFAASRLDCGSVHQEQQHPLLGANPGGQHCPAESGLRV